REGYPWTINTSKQPSQSQLPKAISSSSHVRPRYLTSKKIVISSYYYHDANIGLLRNRFGHQGGSSQAPAHAAPEPIRSTKNNQALRRTQVLTSMIITYSQLPSASITPGWLE